MCFVWSRTGKVGGIRYKARSRGRTSPDSGFLSQRNAQTIKPTTVSLRLTQAVVVPDVDTISSQVPNATSPGTKFRLGAPKRNFVYPNVSFRFERKLRLQVDPLTAETFLRKTAETSLRGGNWYQYEYDELPCFPCLTCRQE